MMNFRAEKYGIEPNVTGIEEEINLAYLDGEREGYDDGYDIGKKDGYNDSIDKTAKALIQEGCDNKFIAKITSLDIKTIQKLRNE